MTALPGNIPELSVSELSFALKRTVEDAFAWVRVRGEIGDFKVAASGHAYFRLKDDKAVLDCVCWRIGQKRFGFKPEEGLEVICSGKVTTYPGRSNYQLVVEQMEPAGVGALLALLEQRKAKLAAEGLFDSSRKRPLPFWPMVIGVVTSPTGAVIRDILHRLEERLPCRVVVWPVLVQGEGSAAQIAAAITGFSELPVGGPVPRPDLLIVARGGGSIEDLWAFNEEIVVRAAAASTIPLISAVGHETDTTLIDLVADRRAPTPTAAAEIAVPVRHDLLLQVGALGDRMTRAVDREIKTLRERIDGLRRGLAEPRQLLTLAIQRLDDLAERLRLRSPAFLVQSQRDRLLQRAARLDELLRDQLRRSRRDLGTIGQRLRPDPVMTIRARGADVLERSARTLDRSIQGLVESRLSRLDREAALLSSLGHERVLERGYAILRSKATGRVIARLSNVGDEVRFEVQLADGRLELDRGGIGRPRRRTTPDPEQRKLL